MILDLESFMCHFGRMMKSNAHKVIEEIEDKAYKQGFADGWRSAESNVKAVLAKPVEPIAPGELVAAPSKGNPFRSGTASANVYEFIKAHPGKRGVEIFEALGIKTKIGRTALWRMKRDEIAVNENGWRIL